jgi:hypothetical protein
MFLYFRLCCSLVAPPTSTCRGWSLPKISADYCASADKTCFSFAVKPLTQACHHKAPRQQEQGQAGAAMEVLAVLVAMAAVAVAGLALLVLLGNPEAPAHPVSQARQGRRARRALRVNPASQASQDPPETLEKAIADPTVPVIPAPAITPAKGTVRVAAKAKTNEG